MWRDIPGYEGYEITKTGKVRNKKTKKLLKPWINSTNYYLRVNLMLNGIAKAPLVHVLVAAAYLENSFNLPDVNHKNNKRQDNRVTNLEYVSHSDNMKQVWATGGRKGWTKKLITPTRSIQRTNLKIRRKTYERK